MLQQQMEKIYRDIPPEQIPWNIKIPPDIFAKLVKKKIKPCKAIELGCGAGNYVIYLAKKRFDATGIDFSEYAIELAQNSALKNGVDCSFIASDVLGEMSNVKGIFDFAYDWELLHHIFPQYREKYIKNVYRLLNNKGQYLSVCFSDESPQFGGVGKYRKTPLDTILYFSSESEMISLFKPFFNIEELKTIDVKGKFGIHKAIYAFMEKITY
jgi:SAM-dependent methyltransferase